MVDWVYGVFGCYYCVGVDFKDLNDIGLLFGVEGGNCGSYGFSVGVFVVCNNLIFVLWFVVVGDDFVEFFVKFVIYGMLLGDLCGCKWVGCGEC